MGCFSAHLNNLIGGSTFFRLVYNQTTQKLENVEGVEIAVENFGLPESVDLFNAKPYFREFTNKATNDWKYVSGLNIFAAPYDFRKTPGKFQLGNICKTKYGYHISKLTLLS